MSEKKKFLVLFNSEKLIMDSLTKKQLKLYKLLRDCVVEYDFDFGIALTAVIKHEKIDSDFEKNLVEVVRLFKAVHTNSEKHPAVLLQTMSRVNEKFIQDSCIYFTELKQHRYITVTLPLLNYLENSQNFSEKNENSFSSDTIPLQDTLKNQCDQDVTKPLYDIDIDIVKDIDIDMGIDNKEKNIKKEKTKSKKFVPPTLEEVRSYCQEKNYTNVDPEYFVAYYEASNWTKGNNVKVQNWKALAKQWNLRTWNNNKAPPNQQPQICGMSQYFAEQKDLHEKVIDITEETKGGGGIYDLLGWSKNDDKK